MAEMQNVELDKELRRLAKMRKVLAEAELGTSPERQAELRAIQATEYLRFVVEDLLLERRRTRNGGNLRIFDPKKKN